MSDVTVSARGRICGRRTRTRRTVLELASFRNLPMRYGPFLLTEILGVGGTATVFRARGLTGPRRGEDVALKVMHDHMIEDTELVHTFRNEAALLQNLEMSGVPRLYDAGEIDGVPYIATELLHGVDLHQLLEHFRQEGARPPVPESVFIVSEISKTLGAAHVAIDADGRSLELVHRDVSPQNIFLTFEGRVVMIDFGIARTAEATRVTKAGTIKGKIAYMAPEQVRGTAVDRRTDVFALGVVLWECLAGEALFMRETEVLTAVAVDEAPIPAIASRNPDVSPGLASLVGLALQRDPPKRFTSADALGVALEGTLKLDRRACQAQIGALVRACVPSEHDTRPSGAADDAQEDPTELDITSAPTVGGKAS